MDTDPRTSQLQAGYDRVAQQYAARFADELRHKPLDRALLGCFADEVRGLGRVGDVGCGPGHITGHLAGLGLDVEGVDLSAGMVTQARGLHPGLEFREGSMLNLDVAEGAWGGIVAFYSLIHLPAEDVPRALREFHRVLRAGGWLLLSFHVGSETRHLDEWWGHPVSLDFHFFEPADLERELRAAGLTVQARLEREPYTAVEAPTRRGYLLARKPT
jgi:SAM-dependent methyltransferase